MTLELVDARLEYIAYIEEDADSLERWLFIRDILFSFLFSPPTLERSAAAIPQAG